MSRLRFASIVAAAIVFLSSTRAQAIDVADLVRRADLIYRGNTAAAVFEMEVKTTGFRRQYKVVSWDDSRGSERALLKILGPALWRGYGTLKLGDQIKLYDPKTNHVQVVGHSMLGDGWMGSHFTNDDLIKETRLARDYELSLTRQWQAEAPIGGPAKFYRVALKPKPSAPVAWGRIDYELWSQGDIVAPTRADYYRKAADQKPARSMTFGDIQSLGGRTIPTSMRVTLARKPGEYTRIKYLKLRFEIAIPSHKFTEQSLRR